MKKILPWILIFSLAACHKAPPPVTGPEAPELLAGMRGTLVTTRGDGSMAIYTLPEMKLEFVKPAGEPPVPASALSGPDRAGRVAVLQWLPLAERLSIEDLTKKAEPSVIAARRHAVGVHAFGSSLALSVEGGKLAVVGDPQERKVGRGRKVREGALEIWNVQTRTPRETGLAVADEGLAWFPDGRRLAVVRYVEKDKAGAKDGDFLGELKKCKFVPAVFIVDAETLESRMLSVGSRPTIAPDGAVLLRGAAGQWRRLAPDGGEPQALNWPGDWGTPVALLDGGLVLFWGIPTTAAEPERNFWQLLQKDKLSLPVLKVADPATGRFLTVIANEDPRRRVSFTNAWTPAPEVVQPARRKK